MIASLRTVSFIICASLFSGVAICSGQISPPAPQTITPVAASSAVEAVPVPAPRAAGKIPPGKSGQPGSKDGAPPKASGASAKPYVIGCLDVLEIQVWNAANLSGFFTVGSDGMISMPLVGQIKADGLTQSELNHLLRERLADGWFTEAPEVNVQLARNNSKKYTVFGAVYKPGEFPLNTEMTVMDAIGTFGGFRDFAKKKKIRIVRGKQTFFFNYDQVSHGRNLEQNIKLENGDWIFVEGE